MWRANTITAIQFQAGGHPKFRELPNTLRSLSLGQDKMKAKGSSNILRKDEHHADPSIKTSTKR